MLATSGVMARLATTYAELAAAMERLGGQQRAMAERLPALSGTARDLSSRASRNAL